SPGLVAGRTEAVRDTAGGSSRGRPLLLRIPPPSGRRSAGRGRQHATVPQRQSLRPPARTRGPGRETRLSKPPVARTPFSPYLPRGQFRRNSDDEGSDPYGRVLRIR